MFWQWDFKRWQENICSRKSNHKNAEERGWKSSMGFDAKGKMVSTLQNTYADLETKDMGFTNFSELKGSPNTANHIRKLISDMHNNDQMIPHRRRGFEYEAMVYELLRRAEIQVPRPIHPVFKTHSFMVIYAENSVDNIKSGKLIGQDIEKSLLSRQQTITSIVSV